MAKQTVPKVKSDGNRIVRWTAAALAVVLIAGTGAVLLYGSHAATGGSLSLSPATGSMLVGSTMSVTVQVNSGTDTMSTVEADLTYPSTLLQYKGIVTTGSQFNDATPPVTTGTGTLAIVRASTIPVTGTANFVTVEFNVIAAGTATIAFAPTSAIYRQADAVNIFSASTPGTYTFTLPPVTGDVNGDRHVNSLDIALMMSNWNKTGVTKAQGDLSGDGKVTALDIAIMLTNWGV